jgi:hypothetical protein
MQRSPLKLPSNSPQHKLTNQPECISTDELSADILEREKAIL